MDKVTIERVMANGELNCSNCINYLSVGPVLYNSKFGNLCGRKACALLASLHGNNSVQVLYENVVQFSQFPCRYRNAGCSSVVKWGEVGEHEETCEYRNFACPFLLNDKLCNWTGDESEFLLHAKRIHPEREFENFRKVTDIPKLSQEYFFLNIVGNIVLIMLYLDDTEKSFLCRIWAGDCTRKRLKCRIKFIDGTTRESIFMTVKEVEILHPRVPEDIKQRYSEISLNTIENLLKDYLHFGISFKFDNAEVNIEKFAVFPKRDAKDVSRYLRVVEPLSGLERNPMCTHSEPSSSVCGTRSYVFSEKGVEFKVCDDCLGSERFRLLYTLAETIYNNRTLLCDRPCKNSSRGCDYIGSFFAIQAHHNICDYAEKKCIFCNIPVENLLAHAKEHHNVIKNGDFCALDFEPSTKSQYIILFEGHLFFLNFEINENGKLRYQIDCAGMKELRYIYVLKFFSFRAEPEITIKSMCYPGEVSFEKYKISKNLSKKTTIPRVVLEQFFPLKILKLRIKILSLSRKC